jgi:hypothetical protein
VKNVTGGGNMYMFNSPFTYSLDKVLIDELDLKRLEPGIKPVLIQFFMGIARPGEKRIGGSVLHGAAAPNLNVQLSGSKRWTLIEPVWSNWLNLKMLQTQFAAFCAIKYPAHDRWTNFPRYEGVIHPGDAVFIPPWYFHEVANLPGPDWQMSIAIRFPRIRASLSNHAGLCLLTDLGVRERKGIPGTRLFLMPLIDFYTNPPAQKISYAANEAESFRPKGWDPSDEVAARESAQKEQEAQEPKTQYPEEADRDYE